jgi:hypothetical protein
MIYEFNIGCGSNKFDGQRDRQTNRYTNKWAERYRLTDRQIYKSNRQHMNRFNVGQTD